MHACQVLRLRKEKSALLGYENFAELSMSAKVTSTLSTPLVEPARLAEFDCTMCY